MFDGRSIDEKYMAIGLMKMWHKPMFMNNLVRINELLFKSLNLLLLFFLKICIPSWMNTPHWIQSLSIGEDLSCYLCLWEKGNVSNTVIHGKMEV